MKKRESLSDLMIAAIGNLFESLAGSKQSLIWNQVENERPFEKTCDFHMFEAMKNDVMSDSVKKYWNSESYRSERNKQTRVPTKLVGGESVVTHRPKSVLAAVAQGICPTTLSDSRILEVLECYQSVARSTNSVIALSIGATVWAGCLSTQIKDISGIFTSSLPSDIYIVPQKKFIEIGVRALRKFRSHAGVNMFWEDRILIYRSSVSSKYLDSYKQKAVDLAEDGVFVRRQFDLDRFEGYRKRYEEMQSKRDEEHKIRQTFESNMEKISSSLRGDIESVRRLPKHIWKCQDNPISVLELFAKIAKRTYIRGDDQPTQEMAVDKDRVVKELRPWCSLLQINGIDVLLSPCGAPIWNFLISESEQLKQTTSSSASLDIPDKSKLVSIHSSPHIKWRHHKWTTENREPKHRPAATSWISSLSLETIEEECRVERQNKSNERAPSEWSQTLRNGQSTNTFYFRPHELDVQAESPTMDTVRCEHYHTDPNLIEREMQRKKAERGKKYQTGVQQIRLSDRGMEVVEIPMDIKGLETAAQAAREKCDGDEAMLRKVDELVASLIRLQQTGRLQPRYEVKPADPLKILDDALKEPIPNLRDMLIDDLDSKGGRHVPNFSLVSPEIVDRQLINE
eukprot:GHVH01001081.1.p1 GENE.GHVH01001081.1~~GHVH01001081.1.p1  ORF type:complete len:626 (-),score=65.43 GHVH01001081.1:1439-3316(-)